MNQRCVRQDVSDLVGLQMPDLVSFHGEVVFQRRFRLRRQKLRSGLAQFLRALFNKGFTDRVFNVFAHRDQTDVAGLTSRLNCGLSDFVFNRLQILL